MGRPERSLDLEGSLLAQFAADLRRVREQAGKPTYRAMSRLAHRSQTTLSEAAGGRTIPTWETVQAFLQACDITEFSQWRKRWERLGGTPSSLSAGSVETTHAETGVGRRRNRMLAAIITAVALVAGLTLAVLLASDQSINAPEGSSAAGVADGADPEESGCANDPAATTVDAKEVDVDQAPAGVIELRFSPRCGVSWPRFTPADPRYSTINRPGPIEAHVSVVPVDNQAGAVTFSMKYVGLPVFGNVINSLATCVRAEAYFSGPSWQSTTGKTACYKGSVAARY
ncbi:helix-turn-helix domain-containing protein [Amycolatopsis sp. cmx-8-4]|uniref:helix-turn-helix domain-containing protein n=1 Tax=Amycolatopsis sp. cmx-8-4 TaxID=2790947 RepID=UPI003978E7CB